MKVINPVGRKFETGADYDIVPYGCACSNGTNWESVSYNASCSTCACTCSFDNYSSNYNLGSSRTFTWV